MAFWDLQCDPVTSGLALPVLCSKMAAGLGLCVFQFRAGPLDVKLLVVSKVEQDELKIKDQQQVKEEESPVNIREDSDKVTPSVRSGSDQEEETNMTSPWEIKEEEIPVNISEGPLDVKPPVVSKVEQDELNIRDQQQVKEEEIPVNIREDDSRELIFVCASSQQGVAEQEVEAGDIAWRCRAKDG
ncbi:uncharacterized protein O3C94_014362 [Discoglossus pictus]